MKSSSLRGKFKKDFVKPLYGKIKNKKVKPLSRISVDVNRTFNLCGLEICVNEKVINDTIKENVNDVHRNISYDKNYLPGACADVNLKTGHEKQFHAGSNNILRGHANNRKIFAMLSNEQLNVETDGEKSDKLIQAENNLQRVS